MVKEQLEKRGIRDSRVLQAMRDVPRHLFVSPQFQNKAYEDGPLPIESKQTISQPSIVASMIELIEPQSTFRACQLYGGFRIRSGNGLNFGQVGVQQVLGGFGVLTPAFGHPYGFGKLHRLGYGLRGWAGGGFGFRGFGGLWGRTGVRPGGWTD